MSDKNNPWGTEYPWGRTPERKRGNFWQVRSSESVFFAREPYYYIAMTDNELFKIRRTCTYFGQRGYVLPTLVSLRVKSVIESLRKIYQIISLETRELSKFWKSSASGFGSRIF